MNEYRIRQIIKETINSYFRTVDNIQETLRFICENWESPDDVWWLKIDARRKDVLNFNKRSHKKKATWYRKSFLDSTCRDNHVGYALIRGRNKEECAKSFLNCVIHLNPWAAEEYGMKTVRSNGNGSAIRELCDFFFARAYMTLNKRSMSDVINKTRQAQAMGIPNGREFHKAIGTMRKPEYDNSIKFGLIDCDVADKNGQKELADYLARKGVKVYIDKPSFSGVHKVITVKDGQNLNFDFMKKYPSDNKPTDPNTKFKADASFLVYSSAG